VDVAKWLIAMEPEWAWPAEGMRALQTWSQPRDAWMRAVLGLRRSACHVM
jgi:hypothetical protein